MSVFKAISPLTFRHSSLPGGEYTLPNEPQITVTLSKTIVQTAVAGRDFTVVEIIAAENYQVLIEGVSNHIETDDEVLPEFSIRMLNQLARINAALEVSCELLSLYGIRNLVIQRLATDTRSFENQVAYRIEAISDDAFELQQLRDAAILAD